MIFELSGAPGSEADDVVIPDLSEQTLSELFSRAEKVLKLKPWKHLNDTDWFGIRDPESGETHIASVMGASRHFFAVQVYLPEEGIRFWNDFIRTGEPNHHLGIREMRMVSCEFVDWNEEDLDETDMDRNDRYADEDLDVDGLDSMVFRSTLPGCINWHPDEAEAAKILDALRLLPVFLQQSFFLSLKCEKTDFSNPLPKIPVFELKKNGDRSKPADWKISIKRFPKAAPIQDFLPDELFSARIAAFKVKQDETWEIASDYLKTPVVVNGRPTWMTATVAASRNSGLALGSTLHPLADPKENALRKSFLAAAAQTGFIPGTILTRSDIAAKTFADLPGIVVHRETKLPLFDEISEHLCNSLDRQDSHDPLDEFSEEAAATMQGAGFLIERSLELMEEEEDGEEEKTLPFAAPPSKDRYIFRIELQYTEPPIWRQLSIAANATFYNLHRAIQALFDWDNDHCHTFQIRKGRSIQSSIGPDDEYDDLSEYDTPLAEIFKRKGSKIHYVYDFGDSWTHLVTQEGKVPAKKSETGPICLGGERIAPPEDCGGMGGFENLLDPDSGYAENWDFAPEFLKNLREGKFSPNDVKF